MRKLIDQLTPEHLFQLEREIAQLLTTWDGIAETLDLDEPDAIPDWREDVGHLLFLLQMRMTDECLSHEPRIIVGSVESAAPAPASITSFRYTHEGVRRLPDDEHGPEMEDFWGER